MAKILIVDDEIMLVEAYEMVLGQDGHKTATAGDGEEALLVAEKFKPELILLDLLMPRMDGLDFLQAYKTANKRNDVKIIVFSNLDMHKEAEKAYKLGADKYVLKAWASPKALSKMVADLLKQTKTKTKA